MNTHVNDKKTLWKTLLIFAAVFVLEKLLGHFFGDLSEKLVPNKLYNDLLWQTVMLVCALTAALFTKKLGELKISGAGFKAGFLAGIYILIEGLLRTGLWIIDIITGETAVSVPAVYIIVLVVFCLLIGISEELLFRSVLMGGLLDYFGDSSVQSLQKAIIWGGIIFGAAHLANLTSSTNPTGTIMSAIANMTCGMVYCAAYVYGKRNIWPCVLIHALQDASLYLFAEKILTAEYYLPNAVSAESAGVSVTGGLLVAVVYLWIARLLMNKKRLSKLVNTISPKR